MTGTMISLSLARFRLVLYYPNERRVKCIVLRIVSTVNVHLFLVGKRRSERRNRRTYEGLSRTAEIEGMRSGCLSVVLSSDIDESESRC